MCVVYGRLFTIYCASDVMGSWLLDMQYAERTALAYLASPPYLGLRLRIVRWPDKDPTWWSGKHGAYVVERKDMLHALQTNIWRPTTQMGPGEIEALKRALQRPQKPSCGAAKIARAERSALRAFDRPNIKKQPTWQPPKRQPTIASALSKRAA